MVSKTSKLFTASKQFLHSDCKEVNSAAAHETDGSRSADPDVLKGCDCSSEVVAVDASKDLECKDKSTKNNDQTTSSTGMRM